MNDQEVLEQARTILRARYLRRGGAKVITDPGITREVLQVEFSGDHNECFAVLYLDNRHRVIEFVRHFFGTIDGASVHARVLVKKALELNAAAVILAHNHPSGVAEPSQADRAITKRICAAMGLIDVRVLDHLVVTDGECMSFASRAWL